VTTSAGDGAGKLMRVCGLVDLAERRQLEAEAAARSLTMSACIRECLREFFALRDEMADAVLSPGRPGESHPGQLPTVLARSEERLAATLDARATELGDGLRRLETMLDRLVQVYLVHTPEVARGLHADAVASATRRYASYRQAVSERLARGDLGHPGAGDGLDRGGE
jgi:hypothetical protein